jgi:hypothetical protein
VAVIVRGDGIPVDEVPARPDDLVLQVGMAQVDAGVDDPDDDARGAGRFLQPWGALISALEPTGLPGTSRSAGPC